MSRNLHLAFFLLSVFALVVFSSLAVTRQKTGKTGETPVPAHTLSTRKGPPPRSTTDYSSIARKDLFQPLRGKAPAEPEATTAPVKTAVQGAIRFELKGVFRSGGQSGALIATVGPAGKNAELKKADAELFFAGAAVADGYILHSVEQNSVTILRGSEKIVLEMDRFKPPENTKEKEK